MSLHVKTFSGDIGGYEVADPVAGYLADQMLKEADSYLEIVFDFRLNTEQRKELVDILYRECKGYHAYECFWEMGSYNMILDFLKDLKLVPAIVEGQSTNAKLKFVSSLYYLSNLVDQE